MVPHGIGVGSLLGSPAGTGPYQALEATVRKMTGQPEVRNTMTLVGDTVQDKVDETAGRVGAAVPGREETPSTLIDG